jgi:hypothetical protein
MQDAAGHLHAEFFIKNEAKRQQQSASTDSKILIGAAGLCNN